MMTSGITTIHFNGGPQLLNLLDQLPKKVGNNAVRGGTRAGAKVVQTEMRARVRKRSGRLARSLKLSSRISGNIISAKVVARGPGSAAAIWIEYGVKPHWITVADGEIDAVNKSLKPLKRGERSRKTLMRHVNKRGSLIIGGKFVGPYVRHPGHRAFPFARVSLDAKATEAISVMGQYIAARLSWKSLQAPAIQVEADEP